MFIIEFLKRKCCCPACGKISIGTWVYVQCPYDGLHNKFKLCRICKKMEWEDICKLLYKESGRIA